MFDETSAAALIFWTQFVTVENHSIWPIYFVTFIKEVVTGVLNPFVTSSSQQHLLTAATGVISSLFGGLMMKRQEMRGPESPLWNRSSSLFQRKINYPHTEYRGPLGDAKTISLLDPVDTPTSVSQTWIMLEPLTNFTMTETREGISNR
ncbi:hypothetical protein ACHAQJ_000166 [Trichoderma viride]